jgi:hypothetical protein
MKKKSYLLKVLRVLCPPPRPSLSELANLFSEANDARDFVCSFVRLRSFDFINARLTKVFSRKHSASSQSSVVRLEDFNPRPVTFGQLNDYDAPLVVRERFSQSLSANSLAYEKDLVSLAAAFTKRLDDIYLLRRAASFTKETGNNCTSEGSGTSSTL